jgi:uncharacterized protein (DUF4415 family)
MAVDDIKSYSLATLKEMRARGETHSSADAPEYEIDDGFWEDARVVRPAGRQPVGIDPDLLAWFRRQGPDAETRINAALREWVKGRGRAD